jgi:lysophospholipase L1-like esterase
MGGRAILLVGGVLAALGAGELAMRAVLPDARQLFRVQRVRESERGKFCRYDATLGWSGVPNADADFDYVDTRHRVRQNALGFRGPAPASARTDLRRLLVLGDSFVWGFGVEDAQLFTALLARDATTPVEVVNLGVSGYGTDQELLLWRQLGPQLRPDVVLLVMTPYTDVYDVLYAERYGYQKPRFTLDAAGALTLDNVPVPPALDRPWAFEPTAAPQVPLAPLLEAASRSALLAAGLLAVARVPVAREGMERAGWLPPRLPGNDWETMLFGRPPDAETRAGFTLVGHLVAALAADVRASGATLVVTSVPTAVQVYEPLRGAFTARHPPPAGGWDFDAPARMVAEICRVVGVRHVDLLPDLQAAARRDPYLYYRWNLHWTATGHQVVAATLARELTSP